MGLWNTASNGLKGNGGHFLKNRMASNNLRGHGGHLKYKLLTQKWVYETRPLIASEAIEVTFSVTSFDSEKP